MLQQKIDYRALLCWSSNLERNAATEKLVDDSATNIEILLHHTAFSNFRAEALKSEDGVGSA